MANLTIVFSDNDEGTVDVFIKGCVPSDKSWDDCTPAEQLTAKILEVIDSDLTTGLEQVKVN